MIEITFIGKIVLVILFVLIADTIVSGKSVFIYNMNCKRDAGSLIG